MSENVGQQVIEIGTNIQHTPLQYVYVTIPAEYVCVYHRILAMLADYGVEMLKDCKATCKDRNSGVIECFNMFNAAVAAKTLGMESRATALIKYIKAKINQIYQGKDNSTEFVFPVDENGEIKAFVSCNNGDPIFYINPDDGNLYEHKFNEAYDEHFRLGEEDFVVDNDEVNDDGSPRYKPHMPKTLDVNVQTMFTEINGSIRPCADIEIYYNGDKINPNQAIVNYYFDNIQVLRYNDIIQVDRGKHKFTIVVKYKGQTKVIEQIKRL